MVYILANRNGDYVRYISGMKVSCTLDIDSAYQYHSYKRVQEQADKHDLVIISMLAKERSI